MVTPDERREGLAVDIDTRLSALWLELWEPGSALAEAMAASDEVRDLVASSIRYAYGRGYVDALQEDRAGRRAELHRTHGYKPE